MKGASVCRIAGCKESGPGHLFGSSDSRALLTSVEVITNDGIGWVLVLMAGVWDALVWAEHVPEVISKYIRL